MSTIHQWVCYEITGPLKPAAREHFRLFLPLSSQLADILSCYTGLTISNSEPIYKPISDTFSRR